MHGIVDIFAFQESLLLEAILTVVILAMAWVGFRRWLQHKEKMGRLIAEQTAERAAQYGGRIDRVEARLKAIEETVIDGNIQADARIDALPSSPLSGPIPKGEEVHTTPQG